MEIKIRKATEDDRPAIWEFLRNAYGEELPEIVPFKFPARWNWQYADNPFADRGSGFLPIWIAMDGERIIGQVGYLEMTLRFGGKRLHGNWGCDLIVSREYRGYGVGRLLLKANSDSFPITVHVSQARSTKAIWDKLGSVPLKPVSIMWRPMALGGRFLHGFLRRKTSSNASLKRICFLGCRVLFLNYPLALALRIASAVKLAISRPKKAKSVEVRETAQFGDEFDEFVCKASSDYGVIAERTSDFIRWRYLSCSFMDYRLVEARRNGVVCGYAAFRMPHPAEPRVGYISDLFCARDDAETVIALAVEAMDYFGKKVDVVEILVSHDFIKRELLRLGFFTILKTVPHFLCMDSNVREDMMRHRKDWFFSYADHDLDQIHPEGSIDR